MKAELKEDGTIFISPENIAESIAIKYAYLDLDSDELSKKIVITSKLEAKDD